MRARWQGFLTVALIGSIALIAAGFERLGPRAPVQASPGGASSGAWFCPHGGGPDWGSQLFLANPGDADVVARVTSTGPKGSRPSENVSVPAGGQVRLDQRAEERGAASFVEYFGGWIAAGWIARGGAGELGIGAEPCAPAAGRTWFSSGVSTSQDEQGYLVVMNPFVADAVFDVALFFAPPRSPVRDSRLTDVTLGPRRSIAIKLNTFAEGEAAMGVEIRASSGRVAATTTVVSQSGGITSVLANGSPLRGAFLPTVRGAGQSVLALSVPSGFGSDVGALLLTNDQPVPVPNVGARSLQPASAAIFPARTTGPSSVDVAVQEGDPVVSSLRTEGSGNDDGATAGAVEPAPSWVVTPTVAGDPSVPGLVVVNPGDAVVDVTFRLLPEDEGAADEVTITIPAASVALAPAAFLQAAPDASVLVTSEGGSVVALGASTSLGTQGRSVFGLAVGVPMPPSST
jgi:Family of unknown function (DUF5719)